MDNFKEIFDSFLTDASEGIRQGKINIKFHTLNKTSLCGAWNDVPILIIKNKDEILDRLKVYVSNTLEKYDLPANKTNIRKCLINLFANACYEDFSNPILFIENHINFNNDNFMNEEKTYNDIRIKKELSSILNETPYIFKTYINEKELPSISYGIAKDTCYIYNIEMPEEENEELLTVSLFLKELYESGITKVKVVTCMPMRETNCEMLDIFTDLGFIFNNVVIVSHPFEKDEYMNIKVAEFENKSFKELLTKE